MKTEKAAFKWFVVFLGYFVTQIFQLYIFISIFEKCLKTENISFK